MKIILITYGLSHFSKVHALLLISSEARYLVLCLNLTA